MAEKFGGENKKDLQKALRKKESGKKLNDTDKELIEEFEIQQQKLEKKVVVVKVELDGAEGREVWTPIQVENNDEVWYTNDTHLIKIPYNKDPNVMAENLQKRVTKLYENLHTRKNTKTEPVVGEKKDFSAWLKDPKQGTKTQPKPENSRSKNELGIQAGDVFQDTVNPKITYTISKIENGQVYFNDGKKDRVEDAQLLVTSLANNFIKKVKTQNTLEEQVIATEGEENKNPLSLFANPEGIQKKLNELGWKDDFIIKYLEKEDIKQIIRVKRMFNEADREYFENKAKNPDTPLDAETVELEKQLAQLQQELQEIDMQEQHDLAEIEKQIDEEIEKQKQLIAELEAKVTNEKREIPTADVKNESLKAYEPKGKIEFGFSYAVNGIIQAWPADNGPAFVNGSAWSIENQNGNYFVGAVNKKNEADIVKRSENYIKPIFDEDNIPDTNLRDSNKIFILKPAKLEKNNDGSFTVIEKGLVRYDTLEDNK